MTKLIAGGLVAVEPHGQQRLYRLASQSVAEAIEALAALAPPVAALERLPLAAAANRALPDPATIISLASSASPFQRLW
jgi:hypothetical protein